MALRRRAMLVSMHLLQGSSSSSSSVAPAVALQFSPASAGELKPNLSFFSPYLVYSSHAVCTHHHAFHTWPLQGLRKMSCCAGLGSPPPREIIVEYSEEDDYTDEFIKLANAIEEAYPEFVVSGNPDIVQPRKGAFEITLGDAILFSKLKMNRLPELTEVLKAIDSAPPQQCAL